MTKAIDLFGGFGGLTAGAEAAGAEVIWAGNHWPVAVNTHALNNPAAMHVCQDLRQADWTSVPDYELLLAAPACQGHSSASQPRRRGHHDALRATAWAVIDCAEVTRPQAVLVENVPQFRNWQLYPLWRKALEMMGYLVEEHIVTASHHGVAQRRTRLFVTATRNKVAPLKPSSVEPAFGPLIDWEAGGWKNVADSTPNVKARVERGRKHGDAFLIQQVTNHPGVPLNEPIRTITTAHSHWNLVCGEQFRALTGRELARGMGFPDSYTWDPNLTIGDVTKGLGNAVCPPVGEALVESILQTI